MKAKVADILKAQEADKQLIVDLHSPLRAQEADKQLIVDLQSQLA